MTQVIMTITPEIIEGSFCDDTSRDEFDVIFEKGMLLAIIAARNVMRQNGSVMPGESYLHINECFDAPDFNGDVSSDLVYITVAGETYVKFFTDNSSEQIDVCIDSLLDTWLKCQ